jgi:hypothetical protein
MTFGYRVYFQEAGIEKTDSGLKLLMHELVHIDQLRKRGDSEFRFASDYGEGYLRAGNYRDNPLEIEAYDFVRRNPVPQPVVK